MTVIEVNRLTRETLAADREDILAVYARAFGLEGEEGLARVTKHWGPMLDRHAGYPGFDLVVARRRRRVVGFVYGATNEHDSWWWSQVREQLPHDVRDTLESTLSFVVTELAVDPADQRHGLATVLMEHLLLPRHAPHTLLTVPVTSEPARAFWAASGWREVARGIRLGESAELALMEREEQI
jgi:ribosomal protein S18 acetylase RimI-like enzyme